MVIEWSLQWYMRKYEVGFNSDIKGCGMAMYVVGTTYRLQGFFYLKNSKISR